MKICTWNVNGIRAVLTKGMKDWVLAESPDVLCLQEIKATPQQLSDDQKDFPGYNIFWNPAERLGYSGVATFSRTEPLAVIAGFDNAKFDVEGRIVCTRHPDFLLYNIYFPNGKRGNDRLEYKLEFYAFLLELCDEQHAAGENIILTGDFNTAHRPIDLRNSKENETTSGFLPEERAWIDKYLEHGFEDIYRYLYPDRIQYTWWTYRMAARQRNIGWRIDYFLVSKNLVPRVKDVTIREDVQGSDHCPVMLTIE